ncbi:MAG TPA: SprT family protein [Bacilli bacterium]
MEDQQLQDWVERLSLQYFGRPFLHIASFNRRLRSTGGRYFTKNHNIDISWLQYELHGTEETEKIIKHELCHYHLHIMKKGYKHRDSDFKMLLKSVGGTRFCKSLPVGVKRVEPYRYRLECISCRFEYLRKRKVNTRKFGCGKCRGKLKQVEIVR